MKYYSCVLRHQIGFNKYSTENKGSRKAYSHLLKLDIIRFEMGNDAGQMARNAEDARSVFF